MVCCIPGCMNGVKANIEKSMTFHIFPNPDKDIVRHINWVKACNNPLVQSKDGISIHKLYRICRRHFDADCFNGGCKRLLTTAVPTLFITPSNTDTANTDLDHRTTNKRRTAATRDYEDEEYSSPKKYRNDEDEGDTERLDNIEGNEGTEMFVFEIINKDEYSVDVKEEQEYLEDDESILEPEYQYVDITVEEEMLEGHCSTPITEAQIEQWRTEFYSCPKNRLAQNVCSRVDPFDVCLSREAIQSTQHVFAHKVENEGKPMTNQKSSGRCWIFAALNCIRIPFIKKYNLEEFEFSQGYLFYWDKIERCHFFLNQIVATARRGEEVTGRLVSFLLNDPTCDGGQWDMLVNLINKHGLMPKKNFPESFCCESSIRLNAVLKSKLREYTKILRDLVAGDSTEDEIRAKIQEQMFEIYRVVGICLGIPASQFTWEYTDKSKAYKKIGPLSPVAFYQEHVKQVFNVDDKVCIMTDPRPNNKYNEIYTVDCLGNMVGGRPVLYNNQPVELLMDLVAKSIKNGEPLWFGCEVSKRFAVKLGIEDLTIHDFKLVFGVDIQTTLSKADRLLFGESAMTHAMVFTAVTCDDDGVPTKFRVENSWGEERGDKGYLCMSAEWFKEFVFEVVVDKAHVPAEVLAVMNKTPIVLPAWDPMGTLAK